MIPLEDISTIICMGAGLRISTMAMTRLCKYKISMMMLDEKYSMAGILTACEANAKQSLTMRRQVYMESERAEKLWKSIVERKIQNQADALEILGLKNSDKVRGFSHELADTCVIDAVEAGAAKAFFSELFPDVNRRDETPMNSRLNYGYSIIRNTIIRATVASGLLPAFGVHHQNLYNAYNLADDLIEPFRPCVDITAFGMDGEEIKLTRDERKQLLSVLQNAVVVDEQKMSILQAIERVVGSFHNYVMGECDRISLPEVIPVETMKLIKE